MTPLSPGSVRSGILASPRAYRVAKGTVPTPRARTQPKSMSFIRISLRTGISALIGASSIQIPLGFLWAPGLAFALFLLVPLAPTTTRRIACLISGPIAGAISVILPVVVDFLGESSATQNHGVWLSTTAVAGGIGGLLVSIPICANWRWRAWSQCGSVALFGVLGGLLFGGCMSMLPEIAPWFLSMAIALFSWQLLVAVKLASVLRARTDAAEGV